MCGLKVLGVEGFFRLLETFLCKGLGAWGLGAPRLGALRKGFITGFRVKVQGFFLFIIFYDLLFLNTCSFFSLCLQYFFLFVYEIHQYSFSHMFRVFRKKP